MSVEQEVKKVLSENTVPVHAQPSSVINGSLSLKGPLCYCRVYINYTVCLSLAVLSEWFMLFAGVHHNKT